MNCSLCGNVLAPLAKFCNRCGSKQVPAPVDAPADELSAPAAERICGQCQSVCKPLARFCPRCGESFAANTASDPAPTPEVNILVPPSATSAASTASAAISDTPAPTRVEPQFQPLAAAPSPLPGFLPPVPDSAAYSAPAFPQEPVSSKSWIKWAILVFVVAAVGGGALLARKMSVFPGNSGSPSTPVPAADKNAISPEDKARAESLVGPQGVNTQPAETSTLIAPAADTAAPVAVAPPLPEVLPLVVAPSNSRTPDASSPAPVEGMAPNALQPKPTPKPKPKPQSGNPLSLDDLLD